MLNLMYITNNPDVAKVAEDSGVDWIFVDMEFIGKGDRQRGLDTVMNHHTIDDIRCVKSVLSKSKVMVRINPIHRDHEGHLDSKEEIDAAIEAGADLLMLPFFHTTEEVREFIDCVGGRVQTCLLLETPEAVELIDEILNVPGIDMIHIGLNDLHLAMELKFMFQLLADGVVDFIAEKIRKKGIPFGFGGIATLYGGVLPGALVLKEHFRLGSSMVILGRSFCNTKVITDLDEIRNVFNSGVTEIRKMENDMLHIGFDVEENRKKVVELVGKIVKEKA